MTEKTCDFVVRAMFPLSGTRHTAEVVERRGQAGIQVIGEGIGSATCPGHRGSKPIPICWESITLVK